jgi:hypothetical protein
MLFATILLSLVRADKFVTNQEATYNPKIRFKNWRVRGSEGSKNNKVRGSGSTQKK